MKKQIKKTKSAKIPHGMILVRIPMTYKRVLKKTARRNKTSMNKLILELVESEYGRIHRI